jgi:hypothetical protein
VHEAACSETATCVRESPSGRRHLYSRAQVDYSVASSPVASSLLRRRHVQVWHNVIGPPQRFPGLGYSHPPSNPSKNGINSENHIQRFTYQPTAASWNDPWPQGVRRRPSRHHCGPANSCMLLLSKRQSVRSWIFWTDIRATVHSQRIETVTRKLTRCC